MKRGILFVLFLFSLIFLIAEPADAGISLGKGAITLSAGQSEEVCDIWIYATQEGGTYYVETTGELELLTTDITPNNFALDPIDCPQETGARRNCIAQTCLSVDQSSCKVVCVEFTAPMLIEWNPQQVTYSGGILNNIKVGAATIKEPYAFSVRVNPMDMKPIVGGIAVVIIIIVILIAVFLKKRKR